MLLQQSSPIDTDKSGLRGGREGMAPGPPQRISNNSGPLAGSIRFLQYNMDNGCILLLFGPKYS